MGRPRTTACLSFLSIKQGKLLVRYCGPVAYLFVTLTPISDREGGRLAYARAQVVPSLAAAIIRGEVRWESFIIDLQAIATESISSPFADWAQVLRDGDRIICSLKGEIRQCSECFKALILKHGVLLGAP
jgi:hypothetical protein